MQFHLSHLINKVLPSGASYFKAIGEQRARDKIYANHWEKCEIISGVHPKRPSHPGTSGDNAHIQNIRHNIPRSRSAEALPDMPRQAILKRCGKRSMPIVRPGGAQLDAIQRGQKMLDARLQV